LLWQISPEINFVTAFIFGVLGTAGFAFFGKDLNSLPAMAQTDQ
jgi:hypothetical protein